MLAKVALSLLGDTSNPKSGLGFLDDLLKKIRQVSQYSIHAQPGHGLRKPDDISSDAVHNLEAAALGRTVYKLNAFISPWLSVARPFLPGRALPLLGVATRLLDFTDNAIGKLTNMFWNIRRVSKGLVPYDGGISSDALTEKQSEVREMFSHYLNKFILNPSKRLVNAVLKSRSSYRFDIKETRESYDDVRFAELAAKSFKNYVNNCKALFSNFYDCPHEDGYVSKRVGSEEEENNPTYVRSKIASQIISLPAGIIGTVLNGTGIAVNLVGNLFDSEGITKLSDKLTDQANGLMSLVYLTGEVPANINEFFRKKRVLGREDSKHLVAAGIGALGMLNRMKVLPGIKQVFNLVGVKPILDRFHKQLEHFFLMFFSYNRLILHLHEKEDAKQVASAEDIIRSKKHDNVWKHVTLPLRVLLMDKDVTYLEGKVNNFAGE